MIEKQQKDSLSVQRVITTSFLVDISDVVLNVVIAVLTGSATMFSQALKSSADLLSSSLLLIGIKRSKAPPDFTHPYGYGREIYFWSLLSALATFMISGALSFWWGLQQYLNPMPVENLYWAYGVLGLGIITNGYSFSLSYRRLLGKSKAEHIWNAFIHSALIETKTAFVRDFIGTLSSIIGLLALVIYGATENAAFDGFGAMATSLMMAIFTFFIIKGSKELLVGQAADTETINQIFEMTLAFPEVLEILDLRTIVIGTDKLLVNMEVHLDDNLTTNQIERLIDDIEDKIQNSIPYTSNIQIELETSDQ